MQKWEKIETDRQTERGREGGENREKVEKRDIKTVDERKKEQFE